MSQQDSKFFNLFSLVLGILFAVTLVLMGVARAVGANTQRAQVLKDPMYLAEVQERVAPLVRVAVAGQDNSAMVIKEEGPPPPVAVLAVPTDGPSLYKAACSTCHSAGIGGAPKSGDKAAWGPRLAQGKPMLYKHALEGFQGKGGVMPAKGGRVDLSDDMIKQGVDYMVELNSK